MWSGLKSFSLFIMLFFVLSKFELTNLIHFFCFCLTLRNVSHFELDRSVNWLIFVFQTGHNRDKFSFRISKTSSSYFLLEKYHYLEYPRYREHRLQQVKNQSSVSDTQISKFCFRDFTRVKKVFIYQNSFSKLVGQGTQNRYFILLNTI